MAVAWVGTGVPTRAGMENIVSGVQSQGRFADQKVAFEDVADRDSRCKSARELGHKAE